MAAQIDLSLLASIADPELRTIMTRLGNAMAKTPQEPTPAPERSLIAKVIQFPLFPEATRPVSNDMARSALFSCIQGKDRKFVEDALLASQDGVEIRFTGRQLNQDDHDLLMTLVFMAQHKPMGAWVTVSAYGILTALGRQTGGLQYRELRADISRLAAGMVSIRNAKEKIHIPPDYVVNRWLLSGECRSPLDFPWAHNGRSKDLL
jgi:hypothetical protein